MQTDRIDLEIAELNRLLAVRARGQAGNLLARIALREMRERSERLALDAAKRLGCERALGPTRPVER